MYFFSSQNLCIYNFIACWFLASHASQSRSEHFETPAPPTAKQNKQKLKG